MGGAMVGAVVGARSSEVRFVNRVAAQGSVLLSSVGWDVERRGRDGRTRWSGADGVRGAVGGGRRRMDVGGGVRATAVAFRVWRSRRRRGKLAGDPKSIYYKIMFT